MKSSLTISFGRAAVVFDRKFTFGSAIKPAKHNGL